MPGSGAAVEVLRVLFRTELNRVAEIRANRRRSGRGRGHPGVPPSATGSTPSGTPMPGSSCLLHRFQMNRPYLAFVSSQTERSLRPPPARASPRWNTQEYSTCSPASLPALSRHPHLARASAPPPPPGGEGSHGDTQGKAVSVLLWDLPMEWTVGVSPRGGGDRGGGDPLPAGGYPYVPPQSPQREQYVTIPGKSRLPGCNPPDSVKKDRYSPPLGVPVIENRCTTRSPGMPS